MVTSLLLAEIGANAAAPALQSKLTYDPRTAFTPIIHVANLPTVVLMRPTLPIQDTCQSLIDGSKAAAGQVQLYLCRLGNWTHLFMAYRNSRAGS